MISLVPSSHVGHVEFPTMRNSSIAVIFLLRYFICTLEIIFLKNITLSHHIHLSLILREDKVHLLGEREERMSRGC